MEQSPENQEKQSSQEEAPRSVESSANFEGNYSLLLFSRIRNPFIQEQLVDLLYKEELDHERRGDTLVVQDENGKIQIDSSDNVVTKNVPYVARTKKEITDEIYTNLQLIESDTPVTYDTSPDPSVHNGRELMPLISDRYINFITKGVQQSKENEIRIKSITEAHEKGHVVHGLGIGNKFFNNYFSTGFDTGKVSITDIDRALITEQTRLTDLEELKTLFLGYLFSGQEIVERMSQLKGYFGFKASEPFTKEHLRYAKENYCKDTGMDNYMTQFFQAITPEKEDDFLRLINNSGI